MELVASKEQPFQTERRERVVDFSKPLRHPVIISIFGLESELLEAVPRLSEARNRAVPDTTIGANRRQGGISIRDQPQRKIIALQGFRGCAVNQRYQFVIEVRHPQSY